MLQILTNVLWIVETAVSTLTVLTSRVVTTVPVWLDSAEMDLSVQVSYYPLSKVIYQKKQCLKAALYEPPLDGQSRRRDPMGRQVGPSATSVTRLYIHPI